MVRKMATLVIVIGLLSIVMGAIFIGQGIIKNNLLVSAMREEKITLGIPSDELAAGEVIDNAKEAQIAGDTIREHRHSIAPTYGDLLGGEQFDPTNPEQLTYAQALNLENYLYLAVLGFGVTQVVLASGISMVLVGVALGGIGISMRQLAKT
jgi:hypothetical protein